MQFGDGEENIAGTKSAKFHMVLQGSELPKPSDLYTCGFGEKPKIRTPNRYS